LENVDIFYGHLECFRDFGVLYEHLVHFFSFGTFFLVLVSFEKKNLATLGLTWHTLPRNSMKSLGHFPLCQGSGFDPRALAFLLPFPSCQERFPGDLVSGVSFVQGPVELSEKHVLSFNLLAHYIHTERKIYLYTLCMYMFIFSITTTLF
jgi:hypothetical protein